jgi:hypothetical protein
MATVVRWQIVVKFPHWYRGESGSAQPEIRHALSAGKASDLRPYLFRLIIAMKVYAFVIPSA